MNLNAAKFYRVRWMYSNNERHRLVHEHVAKMAVAVVDVADVDGVEPLMPNGSFAVEY